MSKNTGGTMNERIKDTIDRLKIDIERGEGYIDYLKQKNVERRQRLAKLLGQHKIGGCDANDELQRQLKEAREAIRAYQECARHHDDCHTNDMGDGHPIYCDCGIANAEAHPGTLDATKELEER
jgi:glutamyl/glutaminyl-tRNA synthetase